MIRAQKTSELKKLEKKVINCFESAGKSTGCEINMIEGNGTYENLVTDKKLANIFIKKSEELSIDMKNDLNSNPSENDYQKNHDHNGNGN